MEFKTKLMCGGKIKVTFPDKPSEVVTACTCGDLVKVTFRDGVWGGLFVSAATHQ